MNDKTSTKPAAKKAAPAKAFAIGARVKVTRKTGAVVAGRVVNQYVKKTGAFVTVDIGTKDMPIHKAYRLPSVKGY